MTPMQTRQKVEIVEGFDVHRMPSIGLDEEGFSWLIKWNEVDRKRLERHILDPFERTLKSMTGYSSTNISVEGTSTPINIGSVIFDVTTTPKGPECFYGDVVEGFETFLGAFSEFYEAGRARKDYRTLTNSRTDQREPYLPLTVLVQRIDEEVIERTETRSGVTQKITVTGPADLRLEVPETLHISAERDYSKPVKFNAESYVRTSNLAHYNGTLSKNFTQLLLEDGLSQIGGTPEHIVSLVYHFDNAAFVHQVEPRNFVSYGKIVSGFRKEAPRVLKTNSVIGDFPLLLLVNEGAEARLREKGLIDDRFLAAYDMQKIDGEPYVRLAGVNERLAYHRQRNTKPAIEQNVKMLPPYFSHGS